MNSLISVIVPVYNGERYIRHCVESILGQAYAEIELLLINDGSIDKSGRICDEYALKDGRIRVINTQNKGPAAARNKGIEASNGNFIFFIDADDTIENNALSLLIENYNRRKADLVIADFKKIRNGDTGSGHNRFFPESRLLDKQGIVDYTRHYLKRPNKFPLFVYSWGRLFKTAIIKDNNIRFNADLRTFEDVAFNFNYLNYAKDLFFLKEVVYNHLVHENYTSASMMICDNPQSLFGYRQALVNVGSFLNNYIPAADTQREAGHAYVSYTIIQLIRACGQINARNRKKVYQLVRGMINEPKFRESLKFYSPAEGDSIIIPFLMRLKLAWPVILFCGHKAGRRYKKITVR